MLQDRQGFIWFGTPTAGLYRYDGAQWKELRDTRGYRVPGRRLAMTSATSGWLATELSLYTLEAGAWRRVDLPTSAALSAIAVRNGSPWAVAWSDQGSGPALSVVLRYR